MPLTRLAIAIVVIGVAASQCAPAAGKPHHHPPPTTTTTSSTTTTTSPTTTTSTSTTSTTVSNCVPMPAVPQANHTYCGGVVTHQLKLPDGVTWYNGEVTGASAPLQQGALECGSNCTLVDVSIHDNPAAFAGLYVHETHNNMQVLRGHISGSGSLGIGAGQMSGVLIDGLELDHNDVNHTDCGFEAGGFKWTASNVTIRNTYVHDNGCKGLWADGDSTTIDVEHNRVDNSGAEGVFIEISHSATIHDNTLMGNGTYGGCLGWLWEGGITDAASDHVEVYSNTVTAGCNGITGIQQNRGSGHLLDHFHVSNNTVSGPNSGPGKTGVASDDGSNLSIRDITFVNDTFTNGAVFCGFSC